MLNLSEYGYLIPVMRAIREQKKGRSLVGLIRRLKSSKLSASEFAEAVLKLRGE